VIRLALAAALTFSLAAFGAPAPKKVTLLFTGDNGAQVAPCG
jgi:hypothetical protein